MKKLSSNHDKETTQEELKRLRKECKKLASQKDKFKAKYDKAHPLEKQMEYNALLLNLEDNQKTERDKLVEQLSSLSTKELAELLAKKK